MYACVRAGAYTLVRAHAHTHLRAPAHTHAEVQKSVLTAPGGQENFLSAWRSGHPHNFCRKPLALLLQ